MRLITADDLVQAVTELSQGSDLPVPVAPKIFDWCEAHGIDTRGPRDGRGRNRGAIEQASKQEAAGRHRLLKLKRGTTQGARSLCSGC
jgi:hypothetical protein